MIEPILLHFSVDLIKYIKHFYYLKDDNRNRFQENVHNFFEMVPNNLKSIWDALGMLLSDEINKNFEESSYKVDAIELIDFCLRDLKRSFNREDEDQNLNE